MFLIYLSVVFTILGVGVLFYGFVKKSHKGEELEPLLPRKETDHTQFTRDAFINLEKTKGPSFPIPPDKLKQPLDDVSVSAKPQIASLFEELEKEKRKNLEYSCECQRLKETESKLKSELDILKQKLLLKEDEKSDLEKKLQGHLASKDEVALQLKKKNEEYFVLERDNQALNLKIKDLETKIATQQKEITQLNLQLNELKGSSQSSDVIPKKEWDELVQKLNSTELALRNSQERENQLLLQLQEAKREVSIKEERLKEDLTKMASLTEELSSLRQQVQQNTLEANKLKEGLEQKSTDLQKLLTELQRRDYELSEAKKEKEQLLKNIKELQEEASRLKEEISSLNSSITSLKAEKEFDKSASEEIENLKKRLILAEEALQKSQTKTGQPPEGSEEFKEQFAKRISEQERIINEQQTAIKQLTNEKDNLVEKLKEKTTELENLTQLYKSKTELIEKIKNQPFNQVSQHLSLAADNQQELKQKLEEAQRVLRIIHAQE